MSQFAPFGTLFRYFALLFVGWITLCLLVLASIISLTQTVELVRRVSVLTSSPPDINFLNMAPTTVRGVDPGTAVLVLGATKKTKTHLAQFQNDSPLPRLFSPDSKSPDFPMTPPPRSITMTVSLVSPGKRQAASLQRLRYCQPPTFEILLA